MSPLEELAIKATSLSRVAPREWHDFLQALAVYNEVHRKNLIMSPIPELPVNQGRAQSLATLFDQLQNCKATADKIAGKVNK
jgi:hypothetical protein